MQCVHTHTHPQISAMHTHIYLLNCVQFTQAGTHKKCTSLIQSSVVASDGGLINVATLQLFISVTSNLQSYMIGLMYESLLSCICLLHSKASECFFWSIGIYSHVSYIFFPSFIHLKNKLCFFNKDSQATLKGQTLFTRFTRISVSPPGWQIPLEQLRDCACGSADFFAGQSYDRCTNTYKHM